jgi:hypothetical protein
MAPRQIERHTMPRYVLIQDNQVSIVLAPDEWAVTLDALEKAHSNRDNGYSPENKGALYRSVRKFTDAAEQLRGMNRE